MKVLNLYAGIGGNRKLWEDVEVTAVELNPEIAKIYQDFFPDDKVIVGDAHQYLLDHYKEFEFIWSSPPCQTNSKVFEAGIKRGAYSDNVKLGYHDLSLYQEVLLLDRFYKGFYCVENVEPFYKPLIPCRKLDRHLFWTNFILSDFTPFNKKLPHMQAEDNYLESFWGVSLKETFPDKITRRQILRNCVHPETGLYILNCARGIITRQNEKQIDLFE